MFFGQGGWFDGCQVTVAVRRLSEPKTATSPSTTPLPSSATVVLPFLRKKGFDVSMKKCEKMSVTKGIMA